MTTASEKKFLYVCTFKKENPGKPGNSSALNFFYKGKFCWRDGLWMILFRIKNWIIMKDYFSG
jgi:hypothetical protein